MPEPPEEVVRERRFEREQGYAPKNLPIWAKKNDPRWLKYWEAKQTRTSGVRGIFNAAKRLVTGRAPEKKRQTVPNKKFQESAKAQSKGKVGLLGSIGNFLSGAAATARNVTQKVIKRMAATKASKKSKEDAAQRSGLGRKKP